MESIEKAIELLQERRALREKNFAKLERMQTVENNDLMKKLQTVKEDSINCTENLSKNLELLTTYKHLVFKLVHSSKNITGLPISHNCHQPMIALFSGGLEFINNLQSIYSLFNSDSDKNIDPEDLTNNIKLCTEAVGSEFYRIKSLIMQAETLKKNMGTLHQHSCIFSDEEMEI